MNKQSGQVIVILLLVMLLVLSVVLAITQRTTTDLSTSTQTEQSTRAYSAAEAGLEQALQSGGTTAINSTTVTLGNSATATIKNSGLLPIPGSRLAIEYPPIGKETIAPFWLFDPVTPANNYQANTFTVYYGNPSSQLAYGVNNVYPAVEVNVILKVTNGTSVSYQNQKFYFDNYSAGRLSPNNFTTPTNCASGAGIAVDTIMKLQSRFLCKADVAILNCTLPSCEPQQIRVRLLYSNVNHKIAVAPASGASLPPQVEIYNSTGKAGQSEKTLQVFRLKDMVPGWLDFAIFSYNDINK